MFKFIESFLLYVFKLSYQMSNNYGFSLIIMSFIVTLITAPLYYLADLWKNKELAIQNKMKVDVEQIKRAFDGQKRYYMLQACYKIHNYKMWYSLRTSLGLLIQIPFFFAAYNVLSNYHGYVGCSFLFIKDLAKPDGLLFGINILPILMTIINIISSIIYSHSLKIKDNAQLLILSLVFFIFLYNSPSALLIYWTMNNLLSLIKSLLKKHNSPFALPSKDDIRKYKDFITIISFFLFYYIELFFVNVFPSHRKIIVALNILMTFFVLVYQIFKNKISVKTIFKPYISLIVMCICVITYVFNLKFSFFHFDAICVHLFLAYNIYYIVSFLNIKESLLQTINISKKTSIINIICFCLVVLFIIPLSYFLQSPEEQNISLFRFVINSVLLFILTLFCLILFYKISSKQNKQLITLVILFFNFLLLFNFMFPIEYGVISGFDLTNSTLIVNLKFPTLCKDIFIAFLIIVFIKIILSKFNKQIMLFFVVFTLLFTIQMLQSYVNYSKNLITPNKNNLYITDEEYEIHTFSKTEKNVLYIVCDMFNSEYLTQILQEDNSLFQELDGFTWYKDTLSISGWTETSLGALYGGNSFSPENNNKNLINPNYAHNNAKIFLENTVKNNKMRFSFVNNISAEADISPYAYYWAEKNNTKLSSVSKEKMLHMLPCFILVPNLMKKNIYNDANWLVYDEDKNFEFNKINAIKSLAYLDLLPTISSIKENIQGNFLFFRTELPHTPYGITEQGLLIENEYPDPENKSFTSGIAAYYSAKKTIELLVDYLKWLKSNNIYNNTEIVICSDHGNNCFDNNIPVTNDNESLWKSRSNALFLIKKCNEKHPLLIDELTLKSNADIIAQIADDLNWSHNFSFHTNNNKRFYSFMLDLHQLQQRHSYIDYATYIVDGSMFDESSWKLQKE